MTDYREILKIEFEARSSRNAHYSLRAFARDLEVAPSRISEVINYRRGLSKAAALKIAKNLDFTEEKTQVFVISVEANHARMPQQRRQAQESLELLKQRPQFNTVSVL